jgi:hypothetical protein
MLTRTSTHKAGGPRIIIVTGGPGKTTLCRYLAKKSELYPLLLVDNAPESNINTLYKLVGADDVPSLATMQQVPQYDLQQAEWTLAEGLTLWGNNHEVELLRTGAKGIQATAPNQGLQGTSVHKGFQPSLSFKGFQPLTPLWRSACQRLFKRFNTVVMDEWQAPWSPWLADATVWHIAATPPVLSPSVLATGADNRQFNQAKQWGWLQIADMPAEIELHYATFDHAVDTATLDHATDLKNSPVQPPDDDLRWQKLGRIPWVTAPVKKDPTYQHAINALLDRLD